VCKAPKNVDIVFGGQSPPDILRLKDVIVPSVAKSTPTEEPTVAELPTIAILKKPLEKRKPFIGEHIPTVEPSFASDRVVLENTGSGQKAAKRHVYVANPKKKNRKMLSHIKQPTLLALPNTNYLNDSSPN